MPTLDSDSSPSDHVVSNSAKPSETIDASSSNGKPLSVCPGTYSSPHALWESRTAIFEKLFDPPIDAPPQKELLTKTPSQSRTSMLYNFSKDNILKEQYRDPSNNVRIGKLLEDLDALAGTISYKHCSDDDNDNVIKPVLLVTASVGKIVLKKPISVDTDLKIVGAVTWVGRSSIAIQLHVIHLTRQDGKSNTLDDNVALTANFTFVARDPKSGESVLVNRLSPETEQEKKLYEVTGENDKLRKKKRGERGREVENGEETDRLNALLAEGRIYQGDGINNRDSILIRDTRLENSLVCNPQQRNIHGRILGGFLMHRAFELGYWTAYAFAGLMPSFLEVDHVDFLRPVVVGDFLQLKSCVLYTKLENPERPLIIVEVVSHVTRPELKTSEISNTSYFKFTVHPEAATKNELKLRSVVPSTEEEARQVLERIEAEKS
ncbi:Acyl-coenzyme A thioesterase 2 [Ranunculus cassubicifolius]